MRLTAWLARWGPLCGDWGEELGWHLDKRLCLLPGQGIMAKARASSQAVILAYKLASDDPLHVVSGPPDLWLLVID